MQFLNGNVNLTVSRIIQNHQQKRLRHFSTARNSTLPATVQQSHEKMMLSDQVSTTINDGEGPLTLLPCTSSVVPQGRLPYVRRAHNVKKSSVIQIDHL